MSEKHTKKFEHLEEEPSTNSHEVVSNSHETADTAKKLEEQKEQLSEARELVSKQSTEKDQLLDTLKTEQAPKDEEYESKRPIGPQAKKQTFKTEIGHIRRKLGKADRLGSKVIHQPVVRAASEVSSKTVARPSGLLGGGVVAFLGTLTYLYLTKHIGLKYNYSIFLFLLVIGFAVGLVLEAIIRLSRGRRSI